MNKKATTAIVIVLVLLVGAYGAYRVYNHSKRLSAPQATVATTEKQSSSSLKDLLGMGKAQSCTFTEESTQGTIYIDAGKVRGDFESTEGSIATRSHIIDLDNTSYIWTDGQNTGFKTTFDPNASPAAVAGSPKPTEQGNTAIDANAKIDYKCGNWTVDSTKFDLPKGVTFSSFSVPVNAPTGGSQTNLNSLCASCDSLTGDDKTQCLIALKCN